METVNKKSIPARAWNEMAGKMEDTSLPHWQAYYTELDAWNEKMQKEKPMREKFSNENEYRGALNAWSFISSVDEPNKPGYYRANND